MRFDRGYEDKHVAVWNVTNKKKVSEINILEGHVAGVNCVSFSPCGNLLASWDYSGMLIICCLLYTSPSPRDRTRSRMPSSA